MSRYNKHNKKDDTKLPWYEVLIGFIVYLFLTFKFQFMNRALSRLSILYLEVDELQEYVLVNVLEKGTEWLLTDEYAYTQGRIDEIDFEIDYIELLNSNNIKNQVYATKDIGNR